MDDFQIPPHRQAVTVMQFETMRLAFIIWISIPFIASCQGDELEKAVELGKESYKVDIEKNCK